jgi:ATP-dependent 26S proteasome regulatory subunit
MTTNEKEPEKPRDDLKVGKPEGNGGQKERPEIKALRENLMKTYPDLSEFRGDKQTTKELYEISMQMGKSNIFKFMGIKPDKSFLFYGPNGLGKTYGSDCIVGELRDDLKVPIILDYSIGTYGTAYINMGSKNLQTFFDNGKKILDNPEADMVIYRFDECEHLMGKRGGRNGHKEDDKLLGTLMENLQEIHNEDSERYTIFMTNFPKMIDEASIRTGRIDRKIEFRLPDLESRIDLFKYGIEKINNNAEYEIIPKSDYEKLAKESEGFNCADCIDIPRRAVRNKVLEYIVYEDQMDPYQTVTNKEMIEEIQKHQGVGTKTKKTKIGFGK